MKLTYLQRKSNVAPLPWAWCIGLGTSTLPVKEVYRGHEFGDTVWLCRHDVVYLCADESTRVDGLLADMARELDARPEHVSQIRVLFERKAKRFMAFVDELAAADWQAASDEELADFYRRLVDEYNAAYPYAEPLAFAVSGFAEGVKDRFLEKGSLHDFSLLITAPEKSFLQREEESLLAIAVLAKKEGFSTAVKELLEKHTDEFTWVPFDYGAIHFTEDHFVNEVKELLKKDRADLQSSYEQLRDFSLIIRKKQLAIESALGLSDRMKLDFSIIRDCAFLMDYKKEIFTQGHWHARRLFDVIAQRLQVPRHLVQFILPAELDDVLRGKKPLDRSALDGRYEGMILIASSDGIRIKEGAEAKTIIDKFFASRTEKEIRDELQGRVAQPGKVLAKVRVMMDARECSALQEGEILVTAMTSPDYMTAVKRAAGIITDEGGITCHAAIVSRELGIPCIIGTKDATKVLKTGDLVELNANHGVVRRC